MGDWGMVSEGVVEEMGEENDERRKWALHTCGVFGELSV